MNNREVMGGSNIDVAGNSRAPHRESVCFLTLGCKLNQCETEELRRQFVEHGFQPVDDLSLADIAFISTCGVTTRAEQKSRQAIRHVAHSNPKTKIIVAGCAVQRSPDSFAAIPEVSQILGSKERMEPFLLLDSSVRRAVSDLDPYVVSFAAGAPEGRTRALLKIQDGCSATCTYCVVPQSRGSSRSVPPDIVLNSAKKLAESGFKEIVLSGVHIGDYGKGFDDWNLCGLIDELESLITDCRFRLSSLEPWAITPELIQRITTKNRVCPHFHIPFQSGSSDVLKRMGRPYSRDDLDEILLSISRYPGIGLGGDVIAGFPGESEGDFQLTVDLINKYPFSYLHIFPFSPRPGTPAYDFPNQLRNVEITKRAKVLRDLAEKKKTEFHKSILGSTQQVLFEHKLSQGYRHGTAANYVKVRVKGGGINPGEIHPIKIANVQLKPITGVKIHENHGEKHG